MKHLSFSILLLLVFASPLFAQWDPDGLMLETGSMQSPAAVPDDEGGAWLFYTGSVEIMPPFTSPAAILQKISADGTFQFAGDGVQVSSSSSGQAFAVAIYPRSDGNVLVLHWERDVMRGSGLMASIYNDEGNAVLEEPVHIFEGMIPVAIHYNNPGISCSDGNNGAWCLTTSSMGDSLYVAGVNGDGTPKAVQHPLISTSIQWSYEYAIAAGSEGDAWITWRDASSSTLYLQHLLSDGSMETEPVELTGTSEVVDLMIQAGGNGLVYVEFFQEAGWTVVRRDPVDDSILTHVDSHYNFSGWHAPLITEYETLLVVGYYQDDEYGYQDFTQLNIQVRADTLGIIPESLHSTQNLTGASMEVTRFADGSIAILKRWQPEEPSTETPVRYSGYRFEQGWEWWDSVWEDNPPLFEDENFAYDPGIPWMWPLADGSLLVALNRHEDLSSSDVLLYRIDTNGHISGQASVSEALNSPDHFRLSPAWPNPFNATTRLTYTIPVAGEVRVSVYDLLGREVALLDQGQRSAGQHSVSWNSDRPSDGTLPSGSYFIRLQSETGVQVQRVVLLK